MRLEARSLPDDEMPGDHDRVLVERPGDDPLILVRKSDAPPVFKWCEKNCKPVSRRRRVVRAVKSLVRRR